VVSIEAERDARARGNTRRPQGQVPGQGQVPPGFEEFFRQFEAPQQPRTQQPKPQQSGGAQGGFGDFGDDDIPF